MGIRYEFLSGAFFDLVKKVFSEHQETGFCVC